MQEDKMYMQRCIDLARNGTLHVAPNPKVGAVIVHNHKIIGEGWHQKAGQPHAEVNAIRAVKDKSLLPKSTIYVSLEPCSHYGKTPPCADLIVEHNLKRVVIGALDSNPQVAGRGVAKLKANGIAVTTGVLADECKILNKPFFVFHGQKRPFISLKWAQSADGFLDIDRHTNQLGSVPISGSESKTFVHKLRANHMAILVGPTTAAVDNPTLTTRNYAGNNPIRLILDRTNRLPKNLNLFTDGLPTYHFVSSKATGNFVAQTIKIDSDSFIPGVLNWAYNKDIQSILVEGGATILDAFLRQKLADQAYILQASHALNQGLLAPKIASTFLRKLGSDQLYYAQLA